MPAGFAGGRWNGNKRGDTYIHTSTIAVDVRYGSYVRKKMVDRMSVSRLTLQPLRSTSTVSTVKFKSLFWAPGNYNGHLFGSIPDARCAPLDTHFMGLVVLRIELKWMCSTNHFEISLVNQSRAAPDSILHHFLLEKCCHVFSH